MQAKREISRLWDDIQKPPYRVLFNPAISGPQIWNLVQILRSVEKNLTSFVSDLEGRPRLIGIHGNRFIQWAVFRALNATKHTQYFDVEASIRLATERALFQVIDVVQVLYPESYPASLFKNQAKVKQIAASMSVELPA